MYGARAEKPLQNADFAMKQTNICRLSGDINKSLKKKTDELESPAPAFFFLVKYSYDGYRTQTVHL